MSANETIHVLKDLNLVVPPGRITAVTGVSGSGKSTLLHLIGGMDYPDRGSVLYGGVDIFTLKKTELAKFRNETIGFVFQFHHLLPEFTALENAMFPFFIRGLRREQVTNKAERILVQVGLKDRLHHRIGQMSGGERQRVAIARALVADPKVLLADEPTGNLDPKTAEIVFSLLLRLHAERHLTSILVTHNEKLAQLCDDVLYLQDGALMKGSTI